jgi:hypothetical protein
VARKDLNRAQDDEPEAEHHDPRIPRSGAAQAANRAYSAAYPHCHVANEVECRRVRVVPNKSGVAWLKAPD